MANDKENFFNITGEHEPHVDPCFMTGKRCVYSEAIEQERTARHKENHRAGFLIRPFKPNLHTFFDLCFKPYLTEQYAHIDKTSDKSDFKLAEADQVRKTGYIICEKICKKIQESDFVVADVSIPNPNVFYEMGLAYGAGQKIIVTYQQGNTIGKMVADKLRIANCKAVDYKNIDDPDFESLQLSDHIWQRKPAPSISDTNEPRIVLLASEYDTLFPDTADDIHISFRSHISAAVTISIDEILDGFKKQNRGININDAYIKNMRQIEPIEDNASFNITAKSIEECYCVIIRTGYEGNNDFMSYFWLGYSHAIGKNTIPIAIVDNLTDKIEDLAFDIRSLWYMTFARNNPEQLHNEMKDVLHQMIETDFSNWYRKSFWREILGKKGEVSIFTGALHWDHPGRDMIGDWDLRAVSALTSAFAVHHYRAIIESPVYQIEHFLKQKEATKEEYYKLLIEKLKDKNCIIIASAEVNPMTEICLGTLYNIPQEDWFTKKDITRDREYAVVGVKGATSMPSDTTAQDYKGRLFSRVSPTTTGGAGDKEKRGFESHRFPALPLEKFLSQEDSPEPFSSYAHLLIAKNPFVKPNNPDKKFWVILNGISGPATFALTEIIAGGGVSGSTGASTVSKEFVAYDATFKSDVESEKILRKITEGLSSIIKGHSTGVQYIFKVDIGPSNIEEGTKDGTPQKTATDWRRITKWELKRDVNSRFDTSIS